MMWIRFIKPTKTAEGRYRFQVTIGDHSLCVEAKDLGSYKIFQRRVLEQVGLLFTNDDFAQGGAKGRMEWDDDVASLIAKGHASIGEAQNAAG